MVRILGLYPLCGNGGIASWSKKYVSTFPDNEFQIYPLNIAPQKDFTKFSGFDRYRYGVGAYYRIRSEVKKVLRQDHRPQIMHITSGGGYGVLRDYFIGRLCKKKGLGIVLHCRFGSVAETCKRNGIIGMFFRRSLKLYDEIWVLDSHSAIFLKSFSVWRDKVYLTPNSIEVPTECNFQPKTYLRVGFVGNVIPTKGIFELTEAIKSLKNNTELYIVGQGPKAVLEQLKKLADDKLGAQIQLLGRLQNSDAVKLMETLDIICLPTYYPGEAFPISILEAMSRGKLVISCPRAAIPDMLTAIDGSKCGLLVPDHNVKAIADAIEWCQEHRKEADEICRKAYEKVSTCYRKEVVYDIYRHNFRKLL